MAQALFDEIGVVGVAWAELVLDLAVVLRPRVHVLDLERDRRAGRHLLSARLVGENAREDAHLVELFALGGVARLARAPLVEIGLDVGDVELDAGRAAIDHAADRRTEAFAPGGDAEEMAETVVRHGFLMRPGSYFVITGRAPFPLGESGTKLHPSCYRAPPRCRERPRSSSQPECGHLSRVIPILR